MGSIWRDLKYGFHTRPQPRIYYVTVLSLALGIGANTAIFTLTNAVFLNDRVHGILFGFAPAIRTSISSLAEVLKSGGRGGSEAFARNKLRSVLVVGEVSLALISLTGAGLLIRSIDKVQKINPGFETRSL